MKTVQNNQTRHQHGMSLIEVMITMVIGLLIVAGIMYVFQGSHKTYRSNETMSRMQENGRLALDAISNDARLASFAGCRAIADLAYSTTVPESVVTISGDTAVQGLRANNNDSITLKHMSESGTKLSQDMADESSDLVFANTSTAPTFKAGDIASVADCTGMDTFVVSTVVTTTAKITVSHGTPENTSNKLAAAYSSISGRLARMIEQTYYIKDTGRTNRAGQAIPGLYRRATLNGVATGAAEEELAEGIERMRITYGLDSANSDGQVDEYVATSAMTSSQWAQVISIRVELLVASVEDNVLETSQTYSFAGTNTVAADKKLRSSIGSTIALRNRMQ